MQYTLENVRYWTYDKVGVVPGDATGTLLADDVSGPQAARLHAPLSLRSGSAAQRSTAIQVSAPPNPDLAPQSVAP